MDSGVLIYRNFHWERRGYIYFKKLANFRKKQIFFIIGIIYKEYIKES